MDPTTPYREHVNRPRSQRYAPEPLDTSHVALSPDLLALVERLARNAHDNWARIRLATGWSWGPARNDELKQHPNLVPYEELSEDEKQVDREMVLGTVQAILAFGYEIRRRD